MSLADSFPPAVKRASIIRQLRTGCVVKLLRVMDDETIHEKRYVVLYADEATVVCVINSAIGKFIANRPELCRCQVALPAAGHPFMDHDSFVDCSKVMRYRTADVVSDLFERPDWVLGEVGEGVRHDMIAALKFSPIISPGEVATLCGRLSET